MQHRNDRPTLFELTVCDVRTAPGACPSARVANCDPKSDPSRREGNVSTREP
jgi:hypothetical protein